MDMRPYRKLRDSAEPVAIAIDSTGIKVYKAGEWMERRHGKKKRYIKLHLAVDTETKEVVALEVSTDDTHDSKVLPGLLGEAEKRRGVSKVYGDGAYDTSEIYELLKSKGVEAVIKPRRSSRLDTPSEARRMEVELYKELSYRRWAKRKGYGRRWSVETAYSTFKRAFGGACMAKTLENITKELMAKPSIYNVLVNL